MIDVYMLHSQANHTAFTKTILAQVFENKGRGLPPVEGIPRSTLKLGQEEKLVISSSCPTSVNYEPLSQVKIKVMALGFYFSI
jgi:hypothetical protein